MFKQTEKQITDTIIVFLFQYFEAGFLWKVNLKILNSGLILKTFTQVIGSVSEG